MCLVVTEAELLVSLPSFHEERKSVRTEATVETRSVRNSPARVDAGSGIWSSRLVAMRRKQPTRGVPMNAADKSETDDNVFAEG